MEARVFLWHRRGPPFLGTWEQEDRAGSQAAPPFPGKHHTPPPSALPVGLLLPGRRARRLAPRYDLEALLGPCRCPALIRALGLNPCELFSGLKHHRGWGNGRPDQKYSVPNPPQPRGAQGWQDRAGAAVQGVEAELVPPAIPTAGLAQAHVAVSAWA